MFERTVFDTLRGACELGLEKDAAHWRAERELVRLARAFVASSDPNDRWMEARHIMRGRRYVVLDDLVDDLTGATVPFELRALGRAGIDQQLLRSRIGDFLRDTLTDAARIRPERWGRRGLRTNQEPSRHTQPSRSTLVRREGCASLVPMGMATRLRPMF